MDDLTTPEYHDDDLDYLWDTQPTEIPPQEPAPDLKRPPLPIGQWLKEAVQLVLIVVLVRVGMDTFLPRYVVDGASMEPTFYTSDRVIVDRLTMLLSGPARGDVIVLDSPRTRDELLIKRVIGLPGEHIVIREGRVYVDGVELEESYVKEYCTYSSCDGEWQLASDEYFVLGDNRSHSLDSHSFGPVKASTIVGIARVRYWPPTKADVLSAPDYVETPTPVTP
ncbi:MAG TPA: signal peptidase I [Aggregatilinea sp.]|jgi:signal peptidase I|uniref:signal peptidase I n=1 Tax=Aggregatilinea sp. TaxID=2806333 RepID=UPI002C69FEAA|nr:signal peptidase I [Aggregatilinea sp.]HML22631.1 signal peptidase I [Aggregatilinea sp.]